jgi:hypothetical protein
LASPHHSSTAFEVSSVPLSLTIIPGLAALGDQIG